MFCGVSDCAKNADCPTGYGCFHDNQCKKIYGSQCIYDCDCSHCPGMECFHEKCFCKGNFENCDVTTVFHSNRGAGSETASVPPPPSTSGGSAANPPPVNPAKMKTFQKQCDKKENDMVCEEGWIKTSKGCYKAEFVAPVAFPEVEAICKEKGSQPVEVTSKQIADLIAGVMEMEKIDKAWLGMKGKGDELKGIYTGRKIDWTPPGFNRTGDGGDCLQAVGRTWEWASCSDKAKQFCAENEKANKGAGKGHHAGQTNDAKKEARRRRRQRRMRRNRRNRRM